MAGADANESKGGGGGLIGFIIVTVLALGIGGAFGMFVLSAQPKQVEAEPSKDAHAAAEKPKGAVPEGAKLVELTPIVVNLAQPAQSWIRIEASLLIQGMPEGADHLAAQLAEDFTAYLRTASLSQFEGPSGFQNLREDLVDRATIRDREHIKDVIIHGVVIE